MSAHIALGTLFLLGVFYLLGDAQHLTIPTRRKVGAAFASVWVFLAGLGVFLSPAFLEVGAFFLMISLVALIAIHFGVLKRPPEAGGERE